MTKCNLTRDQFQATAQPLTVTLPGDQALTAAPRTFSTGSLGFQANGKVTIVIGGVPTSCQVGVTVTVIGSKDLPGAA